MKELGRVVVSLVRSSFYAQLTLGVAAALTVIGIAWFLTGVEEHVGAPLAWF